MPSTLNSQPVLRGTGRFPRVGAWSFELEVRANEAPGPDAELDFEGVRLVGTVARSSERSVGRWSVLVAGGAGGLDAEVTAKQYVAPTVSAVLGDICRLSGESLSTTIEQSLLDQSFTTWQRAKGTARDALGAVADRLEVAWRILQDGTIWLGAETWPTVEPECRIIDDDQATGIVQSSLIANLVPGVTFRGQRLELVTHELEPKAARTEASSTSPAQLLGAALGPLEQKVTYSRTYAGRVTAQNSDGTLQVSVDDPKLKGSGIDKVRIRLGVPGTVTVPKGATVLVSFDGGDPQQPVATAFGGAELTELALGAGTDFVALAGKVLTELQALKSWGDSVNTWAATHIHSGVTTGPGSSGPPGSPPPGGPPTPSSVAADKVKAE